MLTIYHWRSEVITAVEFTVVFDLGESDDKNLNNYLIYADLLDLL